MSRPLCVPTLDEAGDPTDRIVGYTITYSRGIWFRRYDDISRDGTTRWPIGICAHAEDLDADKARGLATELLAAADLIAGTMQ